MFVNFVLMLFRINIGVVSFGFIGILCLVLGVVLVVMNFVVDFDYVE